MEEIIATTASIAIRPDLDVKVRLLSGHIKGLLIAAQTRTVKTDQDVVDATKDLSLIAGLGKSLEEKRKEYTAPLNEYLKAINEAFKKLSEPLTEAKRTTDNRILSYRAEIARQRAEAEEINRQKIELARREAALNQGEITVDTTPVPVPEEAVSKVHTDMGTTGIVHNRKYRVVDFALLPDTYKLENSVLLGKVCRAGIPEIAGVEFYFEESLRTTPS